MGLEIITLTAAPVWEAECIEKVQNSVGDPYGLGDSNAHCGTGLGEQNA